MKKPLSALVRTGIAALALVAVAACGSSKASDPTPSATAAATTATTTPTEASSSATAETSASTETSTSSETSSAAPAPAAGACKMLTAEEVSTAMSSKVTAKESKLGPATVCTYQGTKGEAIVSQTMTAVASFDVMSKTVADQLKATKTTKIDVNGASEAVALTASLSGAPTIAVLYQKDGAFNQVIMTALTGATVDVALVTKLANAMAA